MLASLNISDNWLDRKKPYLNLDFDGNGTDMSGVVAISKAIPTMGALASLDLSQNEIPAEQMDPIKALCESKQIALKAAPQRK